MKIRLGMDVLYTATEADVAEMARRRDDFTAFRDRAARSVSKGAEILAGDLAGRSGHQAHVGNELEAGRSYAAKIVRAFPNESANLQVFLDGNDVLWVRSVFEGDGPGQWVHAW